MTVEDLLEFEERVCEAYLQKKIRAPIHLDHDNEEQLIEVFKNVNSDDWVMGSWRMHYRALLKGVPPDELINAILEGKSISLCFPKYKIIASAIVGGILPIALGVASAIKIKGEANKVICFMGDMTYMTGIAHECIQYSTNWDLPILWIVEDNNKSVCTNTREAWGANRLPLEPENYKEKSVVKIADNILYYKYSSKHSHAGVAGQRIQF